MKESRKFLRFETSLKVSYILYEKKPKVEKTGMTKDICAQGMQLLTEEKLDKDVKIEFKLFTSQSLNPVHLNGIVIWTKEISGEKDLNNAAGIEFGTIEEDNKNTFLKFLCDLMYKKTGRLT